MAFTKVVGAGIHTLSNIASHNINSSGIITATKFVGPMENGSGISTFYDLRVTNNLRVDGTTTTLDTKLVEVDKIEVEAETTNVAIAVTHTGSGDLIRLHDGASQVVTVDDEGQVGIGSNTPTQKLDVVGNMKISGNIDANGDLDVDGHTNLDNVSITGVTTFSGDIETSKNIVLGDGSDGNASINRLKFGGSGDLQIYHNQYHSKIVDSGTGALIISGSEIRFEKEPSSDETLRITSDGLVGIGTDNPGTQSTSANNLVVADFDGEGGITIKSNVNSAGNIFFADTAGSATGRIAYGHGATDAGDYMRFYVNSEERLRIKHDGKVGIGTNNPAYLLDIQKDTDVSLRLKCNGTGSSDDTIIRNLIAGTSASNYIYFGDSADSNVGQIRYRHSDDSMQFFTAGSEKLRITSDGEVGIGTDNPGRLLTLFDNDQPVFQITNNTSGTANTRGSIFYQMSGTTTLAIDNQGDGTGGNIQFMEAGRNTLGIATDGDVTIVGYDNAELKLKAGTTTGNGIIYFLNSSGTTKGNIFYDTDDNFMVFKTNGVASNNERLRIDDNGNAQFGGVTGDGPYQDGNARNIIDLGSGTMNRGFGWGGTNSNYANIWTEYSSGDLNFATGLRPTQSSETYVSSYGGQSIGRAGMELTLSGKVIFRTAASSTVANGTEVSSLKERLHIGSNGSVGIGTDHLSGNNSVYHKLMVVGDTTSQIGVVKIVRKHSGASNSTYTLEVDSSAHSSNVTNAGAMSVDVNSGRAFTINGFGKVGIGTDSPSQSLDVVGGNIRVGKTSNGQFIGENSSGIQKIKLDTDGDSFLNGGRVGINTDTFDYAGAQLKIEGRDFGTSHWSALQIKGVGAGGIHAAVDLVATSANNLDGSGNPATYRGLGVLMLDEPSTVEWFAGRPYAGSDEYIIGRKSGGYRAQSAEKANALFTINSDGHLFAPNLNSGSGHADVRYVTSNGQFFYDSSTRLVKTDIEDCSYGLTEIKQLKPRIYKRTDADNVVEIGLIADEVQSILPEIVATEKKSFFTKNESDTEIIPSNVDLKRLTVILTKAIQEQQEQIETLKSKVTTLEGS